jgi:hypothetical protein
MDEENLCAEDRMRAFYLVYRDAFEIVPQPVGQSDRPTEDMAGIPW